MFDSLLMFAKYVGGLKAFLQTPLSEQQCLAIVQDQLRNRQEMFLRILRHGVYENADSPYRKLLEHAGLQFADVSRLVGRCGVEGALDELYDRGVYLTLEEFKGRKPIRRPGLEVQARARDFDNPLLSGHYESSTGGSRTGIGTRLLMDLDLVSYEAAQTSLFLTAYGIREMPTALWRELPPGLSGMKTWLRLAKLGRPVERWFTQRKPLARPGDWKHHLLTLTTACLGRLWGKTIPEVEYVPPLEASRIARWLAEKKRQGTPAVLDTNPSSAARVCIAAKEKMLDISGTFFRLSAEPYTPAKARLVEETATRAASHYAAGEIGFIGLACGDPQAVDEVHLMTDKVAVIQRQKQVGESAIGVGALLFTTLLPSCPKLMLNVECGDYAVLERRRCRCLFDQLGFHWHLHDIRSFEKMNSAGMTFLGTQLIELVEEVLPARFGGSAIDYQFVEEEENGLPRVSLLVSPRLDGINEREIVATVLAELSACPGGLMMTDVWRGGETLRVVRQEPVSTAAFKLLPLHVAGKGAGQGE